MTEAIHKVYIPSNKHWQWSYELARRIDLSGWQPDIVIGLYRGGVFSSIIIEDYLRSKGKGALNFPLVCKSYDENTAESKPLECIVKLTTDNEKDILNLFKEKKRRLNVLILDNICDTGKTLEAVIKKLNEYAMKVTVGASLSPEDGILSFKFRTACLVWKPEVSHESPTWWIKESSQDEWIVFSHEFCGINVTEKLYHEKNGQ